MTLASEIRGRRPPTPNPDPVRKDLLLDNPGRWNDMETFYQGTSGGASGDFGYNGEGMVTALRSTRLTGADRLAQALSIFGYAAAAKPDVWYYQYNWALSNMMVGQYGAATSILDELIKRDNTHPEAGFMRGLASLSDPANRTRRSSPGPRSPMPMSPIGAAWPPKA